MTIVCPLPSLEWQDNDLPFNPEMGDAYYSRSGGLAESRQVFLTGCGLPRQWNQRASFAIGELGFGTGLNFLATWQLWAEHRAADQRLHYVSMESHPMDREAIGKAHGAWPELCPWSNRLMEKLPPRHQGFHRIAWPEEGLWLTLCYGDALGAMRSLSASIDAWFLDGFAPNRNPDMWSSDLLSTVAVLSAPGARVATYSCAGMVRRGLQAVGFEVTKAPGFGSKRERLVGCLRQPPDAAPQRPWFSNEHARCSAPKSITVIGAGISGRCVARQLDRRGIAVTVLDQGSPGGSHVPAAMIKPRLTADLTRPSRLQWTAFLAAVAYYKRLNLPTLWTGALDLLVDETAMQRANTLLRAWGLDQQWMRLMSTSESSSTAHVTLHSPSLYYPQALALDAVTALDATWNPNRIVSAKACALARTAQGWEVSGPAGELVCRSDVVVMTSGLGSLLFEPWDGLPLTALKGQLTGLPDIGVNACVAQKGFVTPLIQGRHWLGATYDHVPTEQWQDVPEVQREAHQRNIQNVARFVSVAPAAPSGFAGLRAITPDHLPIVGPAPDWARVEEAYARLHHGESWRTYPTCPTIQDCYCLTGMGSRGYLYAPLLAEFLADTICGTPSPLPTDLAELLHPVRFKLREIRRGQSSPPKSP